jgi:hypothetical protein
LPGTPFHPASLPHCHILFSAVNFGFIFTSAAISGIKNMIIFRVSGYTAPI